MGDIRSKISDDIEEYEALCEHFDVPPHLSTDVNGICYSDAYGAHSKALKKQWGEESECDRAERRWQVGFKHGQNDDDPKEPGRAYMEGYEAGLGHPYKCESCEEKRATVHFTEIVKKRKTEIWFCIDCAREAGAHFSKQYQPADTASSGDFLAGDGTKTLDRTPRNVSSEDYGRILGELSTIAKQQRERAERAEADLERAQAGAEAMEASLKQRYAKIEELHKELETIKATEVRREKARDGAYTNMCRLEKENKTLRAIIEGMSCAQFGGTFNHTKDQWRSCQSCAARHTVSTPATTRTPCSYHKGFKEDCECP